MECSVFWTVAESRAQVCGTKIAAAEHIAGGSVGGAQLEGESEAGYPRERSRRLQVRVRRIEHGKRAESDAGIRSAGVTEGLCGCI